MNNEYGLGCLPFEEDERDYKFEDLINCAGQYPDEYMSPIPDIRLNQGSTFMCNAFAVAMARYIYELNDSGNTKLFSPPYIYANRATGDYKGEGMITRQSLSSLVKHGVCYLNSFNTLGSYNVLSQLYNNQKAILDKEAYPYRVSSYYLLLSDEQIKQAIVTTGCAIAAYNVYDNWYNVGADGKIAANYGSNHGGHCILIVGWTKENEWIVLNSWGRGWGKNGIGYAPMSIPLNEAWCVIDNIQEDFFKSLKDVENHWAKNSIDKAVQRGILKGYEDGTFKPDDPITRAEACAIAAKIDGYYERHLNCLFTDVDDKAWYRNYVAWCSQYGFIKGYEDNTFRPMDYLTRAESSKVLSLLGRLNIKPEIKTIYFSDVPKTHWACRFVNVMYENNAIKGYEDNTFKPNNAITRAEFITIVDRLGLIQ